jgi:hypothetical protein
VVAAAAPTRRTIVSLRRLEQDGGSGALGQLVHGYTKLEALYTSARITGHSSAAARIVADQIAVLEQSITALAQGAKLPACAVGTA